MYGPLALTGAGITPLVYIAVSLIVGGALLIRASMRRYKDRNRRRDV